MTTKILDLAIVGGGLCGLALARAVQGSGLTWALFEARPRLGGRILTETDASGTAVDLGPTWFWPDTEPLISCLVADLDLASFAQHDTGSVLKLFDINEDMQALALANLHGGARRLVGGMASLVRALVQCLPADALRLGMALQVLRHQGEQVELEFVADGQPVTLVARQVVLALPPRLAAENLRFEPPLPAPVMRALMASHTWMADQAKAVTVFPSAFWRTAGQSGNAFVTHEQAVLAEIFDACDEADGAALGGFFALPPQTRKQFAAGLPMLVQSQFMQVFGPQAEAGVQYIQDWSEEPWTAASLDREPPETPPEYGDPLLRQPLWEGRLMLGGSETGSYGGGHMEGALEAAQRIRRGLTVATAPASPELGDNEACLARFASQVEALRAGAFERYRQHLVRDLAEQHREQLSQRAVLAAAEQVYTAALATLTELPFNTAGLPVVQGRSVLTPELLVLFKGFSTELLDAALAFNRTSCALSNFPDEAQPDRAYRETIAKDLAAAWVEFALGVNGLLLAKGKVEV